MTLIEAALNGSRDHPALPRTPAELAADAVAVAAEGAAAVHLHPYDGTRETLAAAPCAAAIRAVRAACPRLAISVSTSDPIEPDARRRLALVDEWTELPDLVTANQGEEGIAELCELLIARGIGIEAGLLSVADARMFVASGLAPRCARVLVEPLDADPAAAVAHGAAIEQVLAEAGVALEQVHHVDGVASWAVNRRAVERGHGIRTGLEDTPVLPDGSLASGNAELVRAAAALIRRGGTDDQHP